MRHKIKLDGEFGTVEDFIKEFEEMDKRLDGEERKEKEENKNNKK